MHMGYVAYSLRGILGSVGGISSTLAVGLAGVVVVVTVVLVFIMLLRSNGAGKRTASGLGYDAERGPYGQPPERSQHGMAGSSWSQRAAGLATDRSLRLWQLRRQNPAAPGAGWDQNFGGQMGSAAPASQGGWNGAPAQGGAAWAGAPVPARTAGPGMASAWERGRRAGLGWPE